jgi:hypothetical protein
VAGVVCALIEPFYPKPGNGRPPVGVERMLRIYFLQQWFNLSDPAVEEALYDSRAMRRFVGIVVSTIMPVGHLQSFAARCHCTSSNSSRPRFVRHETGRRHIQKPNKRAAQPSTSPGLMLAAVDMALNTPIAQAESRSASPLPRAKI